MRLAELNPNLVLIGLGAGVALFLAVKAKDAAAALVDPALAVAGTAAAPMPVTVVKAGDAFAHTELAQTVRGWFGLPDLTSSSTKTACQKALAAGDDWGAMVNCTPLEYSKGWFDGQ